uniref:Reverse transcriptase Ty1/copia-type domain-containing protein n=1 Tax=Bracon brevicornis TaxID=1563983 RepID=A0A6V7JVZ6_9HYME
MVSFAALRILLTKIAVEYMYTKHFDVKIVFLYGYLEENAYMRQPEGFQDNSGRVCKWKKSLYGLEQSSRCWNEQFVECLEIFNMESTTVVQCIFISHDNGEPLLRALYVDDGLVASESKGRIDSLMNHLEKGVKITVDPLDVFLALRIEKLRMEE